MISAILLVTRGSHLDTVQSPTVNDIIEKDTYTFEFIDAADNRTVETYTP